ncbi:MAG: hypothetical protein ACLGI9_02080 [Thermoanaerobaculia bacterium]
MIMGPGQADVTGRACDAFIPPKFTLPQLSSPMNASLLTVSHGDIDRLHASLVQFNFTCIGFHGCGSISAQAILLGVRDVSTTNARGRGFAVGSKYSGIPTSWAAQAKGGGVPTILRIYVRNWSTLRVGTDYDWGKMDPDDNVSSTGVEMVLRPGTFNDIVALPSKGIGDQALVSASIWEACPTHSFRPEELEGLTILANHLGISLSELERQIVADEERIQKIAESLGLG